MTRYRLLAVLLMVAALLLNACTAPQTRTLLESRPVELPERFLIDGTPFFPQQEFYCGPSSLATALNFHGLKTTPEVLAKAVYIPGLKGSLQAEMLATTRNHDYLAYVLTPSLQNLLYEVQAGHPVIVLQNLGPEWYPVWHYAVVIGYDLNTKIITLHSGTQKNYRVALSTFERTWSRSDYWALVPLPAGKLPFDDNTDNILRAAQALEETGKIEPALKTYNAMTLRWPKHFAAFMGLGNTLYATGQYRKASEVFLSASQIENSTSAAYNNLAVSLHKISCHHAARDAAQCAIAINDSFSSEARNTLAEFNAVTPDTDSTQDCPKIVCAAQ